MSHSNNMNNPVRQSFNRAATSYSATAKLQQRVADRLLEQIGHLLPDAFNGRLLDAGCGTGYCLQHLQALFPGSTIIGLDFAEHMLRQLPLDTQPRCINADIEQLPLADNSIDGYLSSLAWQWCDPLPAARESQRTLRPGGQLLLATLSTGTFRELADCLQQLGLPPHQHLLSFASPETLTQAFEAADLHIETIQRTTLTTWHVDFRSLRHSIRGVGANHLPTRNAPPLNRAQRSALINAYETLRKPQGLPLSYDVLTLHARKY